MFIKDKIVQNLVFFRSQKSKFWYFKMKIVQNLWFLGHSSKKVVRNEVFIPVIHNFGY